VLAVGPCYHGSLLVQAGVVCIHENGGPVRVTKLRLKLCYNPLSLVDKPTGLPNGFARYLLSNTPMHAPPPSALTGDLVVGQSDRHGVEAVLNHRLVSGKRGRRSQLHYLVRWEGDDVVDSWEPAAFLDACESALAEYWSTAVASGAPIAHANSMVVRGRLRQMHERALVGTSWISTSGGRYVLPDTCLVDKRTPSLASLLEDGTIGRHVVMRWSLTNSTTGADQLAWLEGVVLKAYAPDPPDWPHVRFKVFWYLDRTRGHLAFSIGSYTWAAQSPQDSWFFLTRCADALSSVLRVLGRA
jgi:Chromo (CHRromatin Organisation MOdifier) domain